MFGSSVFQMPEKTANPLSPYSWVFRSNPMIQWLFKVLTLSAFLGILIFWGIDGLSRGIFQKDFVVLKLNSALNETTQAHENPILEIASVHPVSPPHRNTNLTGQNLTETHKNLGSDGATLALNVTSFDPLSSLPPRNPRDSSFLDWVSAELESNYTSNLLAQWLAPGGEPCKDKRTVQISIPRLDSQDAIELSTGEIHEFIFQALDDSGQALCLGGDYFETDLSGESWKSRPPVKDFGNGTYYLSLQVHPDFPGDYNLTIILLYRHFEGLRFSPQRFVFDKELRKTPIRFYRSSAKLPDIKACRDADFTRDAWSGRWTRHGKNERCEIDYSGRFRCLDQNFPCRDPWCHGPLGKLESNGWTYSTHCSFRIFSGKSAWDCLAGRWLFFWGDSNHCDTIRNILNFILGVDEITTVPRRFDMNITNPKNPSQSVRITSIFNGHYNSTSNYLGLDSLQDEGYRELLKQYFSGDTVPDSLVINSGLHDGVYWRNLRRFVAGAEYAADFWAGVLESMRRRGATPPKVIYRSTVATGGYARSLAFNPAKMEAFNGVLLAELRRRAAVDRVVDHFDMTFAWHFDNRCNDGVHYGRAPANMRWRDGLIGHQYFVDLMLGHVLLNVLCAR